MVGVAHSNLQFLRLENNLLESLPDAIGQLTQLRVLQVGANRLRQLPDSLGGPCAIGGGPTAHVRSLTVGTLLLQPINFWGPQS